MRENRCPDGGFYVPFRAPQFSDDDIDALTKEPFNQRLANVLNILFNTKLTCGDIDFCIGKNPVRLVPLRHRIIIAELWHNTGWSLDRMISTLAAQICGEPNVPSDWVKIGVRTAVLFGIFGELKREGIVSADISAVAGDFSGPISAWYARQWGLPVGNIICCCNENNALWDLICHGQMRTDTVSASTAIPDADVALPADLERLIYACAGIPETMRYLDACRRGRMYCPNDTALSKMRRGMYVSVVSSQRIETTIPSVYRTHAYVMSAPSALAYSGLLDYRTRAGETGYAVVIAEKSPVCDAETVGRALGVPAEKVGELL